MNTEKLVETQPFEYRILEMDEGQKKRGVLMTLEGLFQRADAKNANGRVYPTTLWNSIMSHESTNERIKNRRMVGELDHPASGATSGHRVSHVVTEHKLLSNGEVRGKMEVLDTPAGRIAETMFRAGVGLGVSSRGDGSIERKGDTSEVQEDFRLETYDVVLKPSTEGAYPTMVESEEKAKENVNLIANAVEGLVKTTEDLDILLECHKIVSVLEGCDSRCETLVKSIKEKISEKKDTSAGGGNGSSPGERKVNEENNMDTNVAGGTPSPSPTLSPDMSAFLQKQIDQGIAEAVGKKDGEIAEANKRIVALTATTEDQTKKLDAAEKLIEEFQRKVEELNETNSTDEELQTKFEAATKIIDEAVTRLQNMGEMERRLGAATQLIGTSIEKHKEAAVGGAVEVALADVREDIATKLRPILAECATPDAVKERFEQLSGLVETTITESRTPKEPLPNGGSRALTESANGNGAQPNQPKHSYVLGRLIDRVQVTG